MTGKEIKSIPLIDIMRNVDHVLVRCKTIEGEGGLYGKVNRLRKFTGRDWIRMGPAYWIKDRYYQMMWSWRTDSEAPK
jgi:hypothetical protein